jgi:hypothetical protein
VGYSVGGTLLCQCISQYCRLKTGTGVTQVSIVFDYRLYYRRPGFYTHREKELFL